MSPEPTFLGYLQLPDTAHQLSIAAFMPEDGPDYEQLQDSSYKEILAKYIGTEYPVAPQATLGALAPLGVLDLAWLYHPFLAVLLAMAALSLYSLAGAVSSRLLRAAVAFGGAERGARLLVRAPGVDQGGRRAFDAAGHDRGAAPT